MTSQESGMHLLLVDGPYLILVFRTLADTDNRGKLNMAEFHVAMGLIYRST